MFLQSDCANFEFGHARYGIERGIGQQVGAAPAAAGSVAAASLPASLARGDTRFGHEVGQLFLEFLALGRRSRLHLLPQIGHLFAVFIGHVAEAAASAATLRIRATLTAALRIGAHPAAATAAAAASAATAGIVRRT